jgi:hypothetical protein
LTLDEVNPSDPSNPNAVAGGDAGISAGYQGVAQSTFSKTLAQLGVDVSLGFDVKFGIGASIKLGEGTFGVSIGVGVGGSIGVNDQENLLYSISITSAESNKLTHAFTEWSVVGKTPILNNKGEIVGFQGNLVEFNMSNINPFAPPINSTGIKVNMNLIKNERGQWISSNQWKSDSYIKSEQEISELK